MDEASKCDRIALIQLGNIMSIDTPEGVIKKFGKELFAVRAANMLRLLNDLKNFEEAEDAYPFGWYHHVVMKNEHKEQDLKNYLSKYSSQELEIKRIQPDIEDCFMELMRPTINNEVMES
jgi:ABC-type multidrug transport system ATPase subunit